MKATSPHAHTAVGLVDLCTQARLCATEQGVLVAGALRMRRVTPATCAVKPDLQLHSCIVEICVGNGHPTNTTY